MVTEQLTAGDGCGSTAAEETKPLSFFLSTPQNEERRGQENSSTRGWRATDGGRKWLLDVGGILGEGGVNGAGGLGRCGPQERSNPQEVENLPPI